MSKKYKPATERTPRQTIPFFLVSFILAAIFWFAASYFSYDSEQQHLTLPLVLAGLSSPTIAALTMLMMARDPELWRDFAQRLNPARIKLSFLPLVLGFMPCTLLLATGASIIFFNGTWAQLSISQLGDQALEEQSLFGIAFITVLLCCLEELGWRGYGMDGLRSRFNLLTASIVFGVFWFLWHIPAFFIRNGYFLEEVWNRGMIYVVTYFLTLFCVTFFINWVHVKNNRSILAPIAIHASMNLSVAFFPIEPTTRIIFMLLMAVTAVVLVWKERVLFTTSPNGLAE